MKDQDQIKAIAELDGICKAIPEMFGCFYYFEEDDCPEVKDQNRIFQERVIKLHPYLTSRDAIVPVIEKVINTERLVECFIAAIELIHKRKFIKDIEEWKLQLWLMLLSADELCEALLRATGNWKD